MRPRSTSVRVIALLLRFPTMVSPSDIAEALGVSRLAADRALRRLIAAGTVKVSPPMARVDVPPGVTGAAVASALEDIYRIRIRHNTSRKKK